MSVEAADGMLNEAPADDTVAAEALAECLLMLFGDAALFGRNPFKDAFGERTPKLVPGAARALASLRNLLCADCSNMIITEQ